MRRLTDILRDIKIEHTLFAMPFAVMSAFIAAGGIPATNDILLILLALIFARSAAMAFNRMSDEKFDRTNPRTEKRPLASGEAQRRHYLIFVMASSAFFMATAYFLNIFAFILSPFALIIIFFYSFTKRFTHYSHFFLGFALSIAPIGAWVAIKGVVEAEPMVLGLAVIFWLVGLDIIYSCQDVEHDKECGLHSIPSKFGVANALFYSSVAHMFMIIFLVILFFISNQLGLIYLAGVIVTAGLLWYQHSIVKPDDLHRVNVAFFNVNGIISVGLMVFVILDTVV